MPNTSSDSSSALEVKYSNKIHFSYGIGGFLDAFLVSSFNMRVIYFYENEIFLSITLVGIAFALYGFWNMINDPILGWLSDRKTRFTERWGRRFPWFILGALFINIIYILIYVVPFGSQLGMFIWLLIAICLFEFFYSSWQVNWLALFPDKFRSHKERTKIGAIITVWNLVGNVVAFLVTPMFIIYGEPDSYILAAVVVAIIAYIFTIAIIPGMREDRKLIERELRMIEEQKEDKESYWQTVKFATKQKNFMTYIIFYLLYSMLPTLVIPSVPYWTRYIIQSEDPIIETILSVSFLLGSLISIPISFKLGRKIGNRRAFVYSTFLTAILITPLLFLSDLVLTIISLLLMGAGYAAAWIFLYPGFSEVIDDLVVRSGKRKEGAYSGIRTFMGRLAYVLQAIIFAVVHQLTFYEAGAPSQAPLALWGIRIIMALFPMIFYVIAFLLMVFLYDLTPDKVEANKMKLEQENL